MKECTISIETPKKILKGAGIPNSVFIPLKTYKIHIKLNNPTDNSKLCSFTATLGNGIRYLKNMQYSGPDNLLHEAVKIIEPNPKTENNNVIIFANNFILSPNSENIISLDVALYDKYTENGIENSGEKISHESKLHFNGHLINDNFVHSFSTVSETYDYELSVKCEDDKIDLGGNTKFYIYCETGQYDMARSVYVRCILDEDLEFIADSSNIEPKNVYTFDEKTVLKWDIGSLQPSEIKRIGFKVSLKNKDYLKSEDFFNIKFNSNCINNSTYTQCPSSCQHNLIIK